MYDKYMIYKYMILLHIFMCYVIFPCNMFFRNCQRCDMQEMLTNILTAVCMVTAFCLADIFVLRFYGY